MLTMQPVYCVDLFGGLRVRPLGMPSAAPVSRFRTHQTGALLAYLAHRSGRPQSREVLIEMFWPGVAQDSARHRLSSALSSLRAQFEGSGAAAQGSIFQAERLTISASRLVTTDVAQFDALLDAAQELKETNDSKRRDLTAAAVALYQPELLPGYYEQWITQEQECLTDRACEAFLWLAQYVAARGDRLAAIGYARQAVAAGVSEEAEELLGRLELGEVVPVRSVGLPAPAKSGRGIQADSLHPVSTVLVNVSEEQRDEPVGPFIDQTAGNSHDFLSLPVPLTRFLGREKERRQLCRWVEQQESRLIVITGPAGVGKSRLLRESIASIKKTMRGTSRDLTEDLSQGLSQAATAITSSSASFFALDIAPLTYPHEFPQVIAATIGLGTDAVTSVSTIAAALVEKARPILLLDNIEHLLPDAGEWLEALLAAAPHLTCVVTSRRRLDIDGERILAIRPLAPPDTDDTDNLLPSLVTKMPSILSKLLDEWPSVALFVDRARNARPDFALSATNLTDVLAIVAAVDGLPLALELAAAWAQVMTLPEMRRRLQVDRFGVLQRRGSGSAGWQRKDAGRSSARRHARHASLRDVIARSVEQLDANLRQMLASLSVFRGGWTVAAAEAVTGSECALDHLAVLCDLSLVASDVVVDGLSEGGTTVRFSLLESVREYAADMLRVSEETGWEIQLNPLAEARARHSAYFSELVAPSANRLQEKGQALWLDQLQQEDANLRAALAWSVESSEQGLQGLQARTALSMGAALGRYWFLRGPVAVGRTHLATALSRPRRRLLRSSSETDDSKDSKGRSLGRLVGELMPEEHRKLLSKAANSAAILASRQGDDLSARRYYRMALFLDRHAPAASLGEEAQRAWAQRRAALLNNAGGVNRRAAQYVRAYAFFDESLQLWRELEEPRFVCAVLENLALIDRELGRIPEAVLNLRESLHVARACGNSYYEAISLLTLGEIRHAHGEWDEAGDLYRQSLRLLKPIGDLSNNAVLLFNLGALALEQASRSGEFLIASALHSFFRTGYTPTSFVRQQEERLRAIGIWPEALTDLARWQAAGFPLSLSLSEAIEMGLLPSSPHTPPSTVASRLVA